MGTCCVRENNIIQSNILNNNCVRRGLYRSTRSSIYQINKENIFDVYEFCGKISSGYYGTVNKAYIKGDKSKFYAVKTIAKENLSQKNLKNLICEIQVLAKLDHPNIVKYYETYDDDKNFHLVMELCEGGELFERIVKNKRLSEKTAAEILFKLTHAISHCHSRGIVHRDMKAENVLFETKSNDKNDVKIIDFGLAKKFNINRMHSIVGTPCYVAPEVLRGSYDKKCDIWALGILTYIMLYGRYPFDDENKNVLFEKIKNKEPVYSSQLSKEANNIIKLMLNKDPSKRPNAQELLDNLWFNKTIKYLFKDDIKDLEMISVLKNFKTPNNFMKKILSFIVKEINLPEIENIKKNFYILDKRKNGNIELSRFNSHIDEESINENGNIKKGTNDISSEIINKNNNNIFSDCLLNKAIKKNCSTYFDSSLSNKMSVMNYTNYLAAHLKEKKLITNEKIKELFNRFDIDKTGILNVNKFHKALRRTGKYINEDETETMLIEAGFKDPDNIKYEEFYKIIVDFLY